jgi:hypothetical protein
VAAPTVYLAIGLLLLHTTILPRAFAYLALTLAATFEALGFAGLFSTTADAIATTPFILKALWILAASILMLTRSPEPYRHTQSRRLCRPYAKPPTNQRGASARTDDTSERAALANRA